MLFAIREKPLGSFISPQKSDLVELKHSGVLLSTTFLAIWDWLSHKHIDMVGPSQSCWHLQNLFHPTSREQEAMLCLNPIAPTAPGSNTLVESFNWLRGKPTHLIISRKMAPRAYISTKASWYSKRNVFDGYKVKKLRKPQWKEYHCCFSPWDQRDQHIHSTYGEKEIKQEEDTRQRYMLALERQAKSSHKIGGNNNKTKGGGVYLWSQKL